MNRKPIIGIFSARHSGLALIPQYSTSAHYLEAVAAEGGIPLQLPILPGTPQGSLKDLISLCDGFLLPGGADFDPDWYGEELLPGLQPDSGALDRESQETALYLVREIAASGKPVLGICLGMQVTMVALGGSLYQDIPMQLPSDIQHRAPMAVLTDRWQTAHEVRTGENSLIRKLSGSEKIRVNSFHHQAVKQLASGFRATAWAPDGVMEAAEREDGRVLLVQWHPENLAYAKIPEAQRLFRWLVATAAE